VQRGVGEQRGCKGSRARSWRSAVLAKSRVGSVRASSGYGMPRLGLRLDKTRVGHAKYCHESIQQANPRHRAVVDILRAIMSVGLSLSGLRW